MVASYKNGSVATRTPVGQPFSNQASLRGSQPRPSLPQWSRPSRRPPLPPPGYVVTWQTKPGSGSARDSPPRSIQESKITGNPLLLKQLCYRISCSNVHPYGHISWPEWDANGIAKLKTRQVTPHTAGGRYYAERHSRLKKDIAVKWQLNHLTRNKEWTLMLLENIVIKFMSEQQINIIFWKKTPVTEQVN